jgi:hypothetical protein
MASPAIAMIASSAIATSGNTVPRWRLGSSLRVAKGPGLFVLIIDLTPL